METAIDPEGNSSEAVNIPSPDQPFPHSVNSTIAASKSQLEYTIQNNDLDKLKLLLDSEDDVLDTPMSCHFEYQPGDPATLSLTPLALAAALGHDSIVELLLQRKADVNVTIAEIRATALHLAARWGHEHCVDRLLSGSAKVDLQDMNGQTPLHLAIRVGSSKSVRRLLSAGASCTLKDYSGSLAIHHAAIEGSQKTLQLLYSQGSAPFINATRNDDRTPLSLAVCGDRKDAVQWLIDVKAEVDRPDRDGDTPLIIASSEGNAELITLLAYNHANIHAINKIGATPLLAACRASSLAAVSELKSRGALAVDVDSDRNNCFHSIILSNKGSPADSREFFLNLVVFGANINQLNKRGLSPLALACNLKKADHVQVLLELDAEIDNKHALRGRTVLMEAVVQDNDRIFDMILERNPDLTSQSWELTALAMACRTGRLQRVKSLLRKGSKVIVFDKDGDTPLSHALLGCGSIDIALELLATEEYYPSDLSARTLPMEKTDVTRQIADYFLDHIEEIKIKPLEQVYLVMYWAASNRAFELARKCIDCNKHVLEWSRGGNTWLHVASNSGSCEIVRHLLKLAAEKSDQPAWANAEAIMRRNSRDDSPLTLSIDRGHDEVQTVFWETLRCLKDTDKAFIRANPETTDWTLEFFARYEKPGHEDILMELFENWYSTIEEVRESQPKIVLHWAVERRKACVVWWLLSKGGYSNEAIEYAQKLLLGSENDDISAEILKLLESPPPILDRIPNPNKEHLLTFQGKGKTDDSVLGHQGTIVDFFPDRNSISIRSPRPRVDEIVYNPGPNSLMQDQRPETRDHFRLGKLAELRTSLRQTEQDKKIQGPFADWVKSLSSPPSNEAEHGRRVPWIHLPVNELHLLEDLVSRISFDSKRSETEYVAIMKHFNESWSQLAAGGGHYFMKPRCVERQNHANKNYSNRTLSESDVSRAYNGCIALYTPYLTVGTYKASDRAPDTANTIQKSGDPAKSRNSKIVKHTPLSLDQYYYPTILDTSDRDNDQVLSKFLQGKELPKGGTAATHVGPSASDDEKKILMVNNLWVWVIDEKTIITAASDLSNQEVLNNPDEVPRSFFQASWRNIFYNDPEVFEGTVSVYSLVESVLGAATGLFVERHVTIPGESPKAPIEIFRESIRDVANQETTLFQELHESLRQEPGGKQRSIFTSSKTGSKSAILNPYYVISEEMGLLYKIRDIRDELQILKSLAEDQETVWQQAFSFIRPQNKHNLSKFYTPTEVKKDLAEMLSEARKIEDYLNNLVDLRQSNFSRLLSFDSAQQSKIIFVFTVITIVFLPLSFLSSLFALDVSVFPHEGGALKYQGWWLFPILFGVTALVSLPVIALTRYKRLDALSAKFEELNTEKDGPKRSEGSYDTAQQEGGVTWGGSLRKRLRSHDDENNVNHLA